MAPSRNRLALPGQSSRKDYSHFVNLVSIQKWMIFIFFAKKKIFDASVRSKFWAGTNFIAHMHTKPIVQDAPMLWLVSGRPEVAV